MKKEVISIVLMSFIFLLVVTNPVYGLMTKEKLNNMLEERGKLIGEPYEPQTPKLGGLPWETKQGMTQSQRLMELQAEKERLENVTKE